MLAPGSIFRQDGGAATRTNVTISFERCKVQGGLGTGFASGTSGHQWPMGHVTITDCSVSDTAGAGIRFRDVASGMAVSYRNITLENVAVGYQRTRGPHSGTGIWPWWNASVGAPPTSWPIEISHVSHDLAYPIGQMTITGLRATDKLSRAFLHADVPRNLTLAQGGLRQVLIEGVVHAESENATRQCTPVGIEPSAEWAVNLSLACSGGKDAPRLSALKTDEPSLHSGVSTGEGAAAFCASSPCLHGGKCAEAVVRCADKPFSDDWGTCASYQTNSWCTKAGKAGTGWSASWGVIPKAARGACCACGGGKVRPARATPSSSRRQVQQKKHAATRSFLCHCAAGYVGRTCAWGTGTGAGAGTPSPTKQKQSSVPVTAAVHVGPPPHAGTCPRSIRISQNQCLSLAANLNTRIANYSDTTSATCCGACAAHNARKPGHATPCIGYMWNHAGNKYGNAGTNANCVIYSGPHSLRVKTPKTAVQRGCDVGYMPPAPAAPWPAQPPAGAKNILYVLVDDLRTQLAPYGHSEMHTPNIAAFAASPNTVLFEQAHCQAAMCVPTRNSAALAARFWGAGI